MKVKSSPTAIKYCKDKKMPMSEFHEKFDKDLELIGAIDKEYVERLEDKLTATSQQNGCLIPKTD